MSHNRAIFALVGIPSPIIGPPNGPEEAPRSMVVPPVTSGASSFYDSGGKKITVRGVPKAVNGDRIVITAVHVRFCHEADIRVGQLQACFSPDALFARWP